MSLNAKIDSSPVWDTSCLAELICNLINRQYLCGKCDVSQTGKDSIFALRMLLEVWAKLVTLKFQSISHLVYWHSKHNDYTEILRNSVCHNKFHNKLFSFFIFGGMRSWRGHVIVLVLFSQTTYGN